MTYNQYILIAYLAYLIIMSLVSFMLFCKDKRMAQKNNSEVRIKEKTLLGTVIFGGACGGFIGRIIAHHKTDKSYFSLTIYTSIILQAAILAILAVLAFM